ncbi:MAG: hypothetical protein K8J08_21475 [Thermoanaerobaculia bacterium]|nr:hypothetical protein [Thermoanaerobaculia bacterium]
MKNSLVSTGILLLSSVLTLTLTTISAPVWATDPSHDVQRAVDSYLEQLNEPSTSQYLHALTDLDSDGVDDLVVLMSSPGWCGSGGCTLMMFHGTQEGFELISDCSVVGDPVRISSSESHQWKDLIVYSRGKGDVRLRFDGKVYPHNASVEPTVTPEDLDAARILIEYPRGPSEDEAASEGLGS